MSSSYYIKYYKFLFFIIRRYTYIFSPHITLDILFIFDADTSIMYLTRGMTYGLRRVPEWTSFAFSLCHQQADTLDSLHLTFFFSYFFFSLLFFYSFFFFSFFDRFHPFANKYSSQRMSKQTRCLLSFSFSLLSLLSPFF